jgi:nitrogen fixation NifU-like protein
LKNATHESTEYNAPCGDEITVQFLVKDGKIKGVKFSGSGCVISMVSASLLTNEIKGMKLNDAQKINKENILKLLKIKIAPSRVKCALLPLRAIKNIK